MGEAMKPPAVDGTGFRLVSDPITHGWAANKGIRVHRCTDFCSCNSVLFKHSGQRPFGLSRMKKKRRHQSSQDLVLVHFDVLNTEQRYKQAKERRGSGHIRVSHFQCPCLFSCMNQRKVMIRNMLINYTTSSTNFAL